MSFFLKQLSVFYLSLCLLLTSIVSHADVSKSIQLQASDELRARMEMTGDAAAHLAIEVL